MALFTTSLFAGTPSIGDTASYNLTSPAQPGITIEIVSTLTDFDATTNEFTKLSTMTVMGNSQEQTEMVDKDELSNFDQIITFCESDMIKGKLETVTVPAGTFNTCKLSIQGQSVNIADVPFGVVKATSAEYNMELTSFKDL